MLKRCISISFTLFLQQIASVLNFFKKYKFFAIVLAILSVIIITIFYSILKPERVFKPVQPSKVNTELVDSTLQHVSKYHKIADFSLTNQNGKTITQKDYDGKIYIVDFFFTTCASICIPMTNHMKRIQDELINDSDILLLSHTVMPDIDTVAQLKRYAIEKGVDDSKWNLVTGDKKQIYDLARKSYMVAKDDPNDPYSMVHTENFALINKKREIIGYYDGTKSDEIKRLLEDISVLKEENK